VFVARAFINLKLKIVSPRRAVLCDTGGTRLRIAPDVMSRVRLKKLSSTGAQQAEGRQPRSRRAPQESDQGSSDFVLFWVVNFGWVSFSPSFFHFF